MSYKINKDEYKSCFSSFHQAVKDALSSVFLGNVILEPVDTAFDYAIKQSGNNLTFPFISIYPAPNIEISSKNNNYYAIKNGAPMYTEVPVYNEQGEYVDSTNKVRKNVKNLYINIEYQIDIWSTDRQSVEEVTQELLFWLYETRELKVKYYGKELIFTFVVGDNIVDNSDLLNYETNNKLYRMTLNILVTGSLFRTENYFNVLETKINISYLENEEVKDDTKSED